MLGVGFSGKALIANADVIELNDIGHYPQIEDAQAVLGSVHTFLKAH